jgi:hypothetical protein
VCGPLPLLFLTNPHWKVIDSPSGLTDRLGAIS